MSIVGMHRDEPDVVPVPDDSFRQLLAIELGLPMDATTDTVYAAVCALRARVPLPVDNEPELEPVVEVPAA